MNAYLSASRYAGGVIGPCAEAPAWLEARACLARGRWGQCMTEESHEPVQDGLQEEPEHAHQEKANGLQRLPQRAQHTHDQPEVARRDQLSCSQRQEQRRRDAAERRTNQNGVDTLPPDSG